MEAAAKVDTHRSLAQGVIISHLLFGTRIPSAINEVLEKRAAVFLLTRHALDQIRAEEGALAVGLQTVKNGVYILGLRRSMGLKIRTAQSLLLNADDLLEVRLPDSLTVLYYLLRPLLLLKRVWQQRRVGPLDD